MRLSFHFSFTIQSQYHMPDIPNFDNTWVRQPQEQDGQYFFSGLIHITHGVAYFLTEEEIFWIYMEIYDLAKTENGLDYLQVFLRKSDGQKLFLIDQLTKEQIESGEYRLEDNYCTLMLAEEY